MGKRRRKKKEGPPTTLCQIFFLKKTNLEKLQFYNEFFQICKIVKLKCARTSHEKSGIKIERSSQIWEVAIGAFFLFSDIVKEREEKKKLVGVFSILASALDKELGLLSNKLFLFPSLIFLDRYGNLFLSIMFNTGNSNKKRKGH